MTKAMLENLAVQLVHIQEDLPSEDDRNALGHAAHYLRALAAHQDWQTDIENAPKDGSDVLFPIEFVGRAFWCSDQKRWVLKHQLKMDYINHPTRWRLPLPTPVPAGPEQKRSAS